MASSQNASLPRRNRPLLSGRKFSADELQLMLLQFLNDAPAHGYELIKRFRSVSQGYYSPSPGVLYPALSQLEAQGLAATEPRGKRKNYRILPAGQAHLQQHTDEASQLLAFLKHAAKKMQWNDLAAENQAAAMLATGWLPEFIQARKTLQAALLDHSDAGPEEQRRIITILQRAAHDIRQPPTINNDSFRKD